MEFDKNDILGALDSYKNRKAVPNTKIKTEDFLKNIGNFIPTADGKGMQLDKSYKSINEKLSNPHEIKFESSSIVFRPTSIKDIITKFKSQNAIYENTSPNAFRLDLSTITLDKTHAKMSLRRGGQVAQVEIMYPNANNKITVKLKLPSGDDNIYELSLEDEEYVSNFGTSIIKNIDKMIDEQGNNDDNNYGSEYYIGHKSGSITGFGPNWETGSHMSESIKSILTLIEADDEDDDNIEDEIDAGDVNSTDFDRDDFSIDDDIDMDEFSALSADLDSGSFSLGGGNEMTADDVNQSEGDIGVEEDVNYVTFRDKSDWLHSSLDTMQKLISKSVADQMQQGEGVILTADEVLHGSVGIKNDSVYEIVDKFLKIYPSLDQIELKDPDLVRIEEKLSLDDGQFDTWLQSELPKMRGDDVVSDALNNEMFDNFEPMGGEEQSEFDGIGDFDDFIDNTSDDDGSLDDIFDITPTSEDEDVEERKKAELEVDDIKLDEFPNI